MSTATAEHWRLPAEWEPQAGIMLTWPHAGTDWAEDLPEVEAVFLRIAVEISRLESVLLVCITADEAHRIRQLLLSAGADTGHLYFALAPSDDTWARDHGPLTLVDDRGGARLLDFRFNGWGGKFAAEQDDRVSARLWAQHSLQAAQFDSLPLVLEGGAVECDGRGSLLATLHSVVTESRNPGLGRAEIESALVNVLGTRRFLWLEHGALSGDDTDGHIDTLVRFADPQTLLYTTAVDDDPDADGLEAMRSELEDLRLADGAPYRLIALPPAGPAHDRDGRRLPATYANFLIVNGAVLVPTYDHRNDERALRTIDEAFPGRRVVGIDCRPIVRQNGSLHCLTMQLPAAVGLHSIPT